MAPSPASQALQALTAEAKRVWKDDLLPVVAGAVADAQGHMLDELHQMNEDAKRVGLSKRFRQEMTIPMYLSVVRPRMRRMQPPAPALRCQGRSRQARPSSTRTRGSRRTGAGSRAGPDDPDGDPEPAGSLPLDRLALTTRGTA